MSETARRCVRRWFAPNPCVPLSHRKRRIDPPNVRGHPATSSSIATHPTVGRLATSGLVVGHACRRGNRVQCPIQCPKPHPRKAGGYEQLHIHPRESSPEKAIGADRCEALLKCRQFRSSQRGVGSRHGVEPAGLNEHMNHKDEPRKVHPAAEPLKSGRRPRSRDPEQSSWILALDRRGLRGRHVEK
jgi:hypothetical protein